jgi:putative transposase
MTRKRHNEEQIIAVLKDAQAGTGVQELYRQHGISDATFYTWQVKYAGLEVRDVKKLCQLEDENRRLKHMGAEQATGLSASGPRSQYTPVLQPTPRRCRAADPDPGDCRAEAAVWLSPDHCGQGRSE